MRLNEYQVAANRTAIYPHHGEQDFGGLCYTVLGLVGEAGEIAQKLKKVLRDKGGILDFHAKREMAEEIGDVLWYLAMIATELDFTLEELARINLAKLMSRQQRGVLGGDGDQR